MVYPFYTSLAQRKVEHGPIYMYVIRVQISGTAYPNFAKFSAPATYGYEYDRVFLWRRCNMLCTSGFMDHITLAHNGSHGGMATPLQRIIYYVVVRRQTPLLRGIGYDLS